MVKNMKKIFLYSLLWLLLDQGSKVAVTRLIELGESVAVIPTFFQLTYVRNTGAAWSILFMPTVSSA